MVIGDPSAGLFDADPGALQFIVRPGLLGPALAFAQGVEAVGQRNQTTGSVGYLRQLLAGGGFAVLVEGTDELVRFGRLRVIPVQFAGLAPGVAALGASALEHFFVVGLLPLP